MDSNFIEAYWGLANIWSLGGYVWGIYNEDEAWHNAKNLLNKAMELDSTNELVRQELFGGHFYFDWNFDVAERFYKEMYEDYLIKTGRYNEALELLNKQINTNPLIGYLYPFKAEIFNLSEKSFSPLRPPGTKTLDR